MYSGIKVERLTYGRIGELAEAFLNKNHPTRKIPVPLEEIIDVKLGIQIDPVLGLTRAFSSDGDDGIEAFVNSDLTQITVDNDAWERQTKRFRFSIAHELGHIQLHKAIFSRLKVSSVKEWAKAIKSIPDEQYVWLEWQANVFAGHVLVPTAELTKALSRFKLEIKREGMNPNDEAIREQIEKYIGDEFAVSSTVIHIRIEKQGL